MRARFPALALVTALTAVGCSDATEPSAAVENEQLRAVALHLDQRVVSAEVGEPVRLSATIETASGRRMPATNVVWAVTDPSVAVIEDGVFLPLRAGETQIVAKVGDVQAYAAATAFGTVSVTSLTINPDTAKVAVAGKVTLSAEIQYSNGRKANVRNTATWSSLDATIATVRSGQVTGVKNGVVRIVAVVGEQADTNHVVVGTGGTTTTPTEPTPTPTPEPTPTEPPPTSASDVTVTVRRFDGSTGAVLVSSGVPLKPGMLRPGQERNVRLFVGTTELPVAVWSLPSTHADGSLRAVMVQTSYDVPSGGAAGRLALGTARETGMDRAVQAVSAVPAAAVLPTDPNYLIATDLVGPTITTAATKVLGTTYSRYETDFATFADEHWVETADDRGGNYYDRALVYYAFWARTGNAEYWYRANRMAYRYRVDYIEYNNYSTSPHWAQMEGVQLHYLMTGDEMSRKAVGAIADILYRSVHTRDGYGTSAQKGENRQIARMIQAELLAWRINATGNYVGTAWASKLDDALNGVLAIQATDGAWRFADLCGQGLNYMDGMLADVLIEYHRVYRADARILPALQRLATYQWGSQWLADSRAFKYASGYCEGVGGEGPAEDVLGLQINLYAWLYAKTGQTLFRDRADAIFNGMVGRVWLDGTKQFNQQYTTSYRYLHYRK